MSDEVEAWADENRERILEAVTNADPATLARVNKAFDRPPPPITWPLVQKLKKAIVDDGQEVMSISLREPTAGDLLKRGILDGDLTSQQIADLIADLAVITPPSQVKAMAATDFMRLQKAIISFLSQAAE